MRQADLITAYEGGAGTCTRLSFSVKKSADDRQILFGEVYTPNVLDTHGEMMLSDGVELMAHRFMASLKNDQIDIMHDNRVVKAVVIESFIAREGDAEYNEGAWVVALKIEDTGLWDEIKRGKYNGFSIETRITKVPAVVELTFYKQVFGVTAKTDGHDHVFFIQIDDGGEIVGGFTSEADDGHTHRVLRGTATELTLDHAHRISLP